MAAEQVLPLLQKAPPGQLQQVYYDVRGIVSASSSEHTADLTTLARPHLDRYCQEQLSVAPVDLSGGLEGAVAVLCEQAIVQNGSESRMFHPRLQCSFRYDPLEGTTSDVRAGKYNHPLGNLYAELDKAACQYVSDHFHEGAVAVFASGGFFEEERLAGQEEFAPQTGDGTPSVSKEEDPLDPLQGQEPSNDEDKAIGSTEHIPDSVTPALRNNGQSVCDEQPRDLTESNDMEAQGVKNDISSSKEPTALSDSTDVRTVQDTKEELDAAVQASDASKSASVTHDTSSASVLESQDSSASHDQNTTLVTIHIAGNKSNLRNFWSGRWRSTYVVDTQSGRFDKASIQVNAHYFENGNVQLKTQTENVPTLEIPLSPSQSIAKAVISTIQKHEQAYQQSLFSAIDHLRERSFKALRRTLPITRQKIDWDKAASYDIGSELANTNT